MTIRVYSSLDTGAPALPSTSNQTFYDNLRLVLLSCLVTGYGSQQSAGWELVHDVPGGFSLSNGEGIINFVQSGVSTAAIYLLESVSDASAALLVGANRRSGPWVDGSAVSERQFYYGETFRTTYANKAWLVVADAKTVTVTMYALDLNLDANTGGAYALHFGRFYPAFGGSGFCALGGDTSLSGWPHMARPNITAPGTVLRNPFTGVIDQGPAPGYRMALAPQCASVSRTLRQRVEPGRLRLIRAAIACRGAGLSGSAGSQLDAHAGVLRGIVFDPALTDCRLSLILTALGISSPNLNQRLQPISLPDGTQLISLYAAEPDLGAFVSLNPTDW
ncbi:hypothetical protein CW360_02830 [Pseudomonas fluvialis]|uniref:Uncharacterized protein n=1 Tax=Pseudomonas fluvialis TaxID=1793966 RepID=A0A2I0CTU3_9PSED|nr:hypothetical protein [Pseudomonas pharmacofabricae]PKF72666.1 hypothetical protein CW360_02830 [Pseudomonas pharmacofabricae]